MIHILIIGSGGREHALAWKLTQSPNCGDLFIAPGNAGTRYHGTNIPLKINDFEGIGKFCLEHNIGMLVVGPEAPLVEGIVDYFRKEKSLQHINVVGPALYGAQLEGSKAFAKKFMERRNIPTAAYREFNGKQIEEGIEYLANHALPIVLKADGLAAGKGVVICNNVAEAQDEFRQMLGGKFGAAGSRVVVESFLDGLEFSVFALTDGKEYVLLPVAKDYKRIGVGDTGLNTGGMGAYSPAPVVTDKVYQRIMEEVIELELEPPYQPVLPKS